MEQTRNKNGKFAKQYRFETRKEYEKELRRLETKLGDQAGHLKENSEDIKTQASTIATLQKKLNESDGLYKTTAELLDETLRIVDFAKKFPITRIAIWCKYGK